MIQFEFKNYSIEVPGKGRTQINGRAQKPWAFVGESGCGKSTLLRALCGFWPSTGLLLLNGVDQTHFSPQDRGLALMPQRGGLFSGQTVLQNLVFAQSHRRHLKDHGQALKQKNAHQRLLDLKLDHLAHKVVDDLSGGESRRIALLRALLSEPRALLLDEPFTGLDASSKQSTMAFFKDYVVQENCFFVLVTHDRSELEFFGIQPVEYSKCIEL